MGVWVTGIGVSRGIVIGQALRLNVTELDIPTRLLPPGEAAIAAEIARFGAARAQARAGLAKIRDDLPTDTPHDLAAFIDTHLLMMEDGGLIEGVEQTIRAERLNAEAALQRQEHALVAVFDQMDDPYLRTRRDDVEHVVARVQRALLGIEDRPVRLPPGAAHVVVAVDITPADALLLGRQGVAAIITELGGPLSHTAILARGLGIPAIVGLKGARRLFRDGETVIVDGDAGHAIAAPDATALAFFAAKRQRQIEYRESLSTLLHEPAVTLDQASIRLLANIEVPEEAAEAHKLGAEGVGLFRTEFLYMNRAQLPDEEEQFEAYRRMITAVQGSITIRTLDLGADKQVDSGRLLGPTPNNPALGLRAIRLCLKEPGLFRTQVRALLRASAFGRVKIMLPMISSVAEFLQARSVFDTVSAELARDGVLFDPEIPIGAMIEVPAAALAAPMLARVCDFFSIGTNDLIQYALAIDRVDDTVNYLYDPLHPGVLSLIRTTITAGENAGIPVSMCGEMAGDVRYTRLLLGLGLKEFSMNPGSVLEVKKIVRDSDLRQLQRKALRLLTSADATEYDALVTELYGP